MNWHRVRTVARIDLKQLTQSRDFLVPVTIMAALFFVILPTALLFTITSIGDNPAIARISETLEVLPQSAQQNIQGETPTARTAYALSVYLFAPLAVIVPLTISTAVGASTIVGERERGTGEFLAHSPAGTREIYVGKLIASFVPGYVTTLVGFGIYAVLVNTVAGPEVGGWFFPTREWWALMFGFVPPFLMIALAVVLRFSGRVKSTAAAQQTSGLVTLPMIVFAYSQATGSVYGDSRTPLVVGGVTWLLAAVAVVWGMRSVRRARLLGVGIS